MAAKKSAGKVAKRSAKKTARRTVKKAAKKSARKTAKKATKKTARKAGKKAAKKAAPRKASALKADRARVSKQGAELAYVAKKFGVSTDRVAAAIDSVGNMRTDVYAALTSFKNRSKAADRAKVSRQPHELALMARKFKTTKAAVVAALDKHGSSRKKVEKALGGK